MICITFKNHLTFNFQEPEPVLMMISALVETKCMHALTTKIMKNAAYLHKKKKKTKTSTQLNAFLKIQSVKKILHQQRNGFKDLRLKSTISNPTKIFQSV